MNGSTVGDSDTNGHVSGQCRNAGLYTAYGAQFMIGSCQMSRVITITISSTGLPGFRFHPTTTTVVRVIIIRIVPIWCRAIQWWNPKSGSNGRGAPRTAGLAMRPATAPLRELIPTTTTTASTDSAAAARHAREVVGAGGVGVGVGARSTPGLRSVAKIRPHRSGRRDRR